MSEALTAPQVHHSFLALMPRDRLNVFVAENCNAELELIHQCRVWWCRELCPLCPGGAVLTITDTAAVLHRPMWVVRFY